MFAIKKFKLIISVIFIYGFFFSSNLSAQQQKKNHYLSNICDSYFKEYEVFRGKGHRYNIIEVNEASLFASLFPLIWFFHYK